MILSAEIKLNTTLDFLLSNAKFRRRISKVFSVYLLIFNAFEAKLFKRLQKNYPNLKPPNLIKFPFTLFFFAKLRQYSVLGLTAMTKHDAHAMTWYDHGDSYSPWYDHGMIMSWWPWSLLLRCPGANYPTNFVN